MPYMIIYHCKWCSIPRRIAFTYTRNEKTDQLQSNQFDAEKIISSEFLFFLSPIKTANHTPNESGCKYLEGMSARRLALVCIRIMEEFLIYRSSQNVEIGRWSQRKLSILVSAFLTFLCVFGALTTKNKQNNHIKICCWTLVHLSKSDHCNAINHFWFCQHLHIRLSGPQRWPQISQCYCCFSPQYQSSVLMELELVTRNYQLFCGMEWVIYMSLWYSWDCVHYSYLIGSLQATRAVSLSVWAASRRHWNICWAMTHMWNRFVLVIILLKTMKVAILCIRTNKSMKHVVKLPPIKNYRMVTMQSDFRKVDNFCMFCLTNLILFTYNYDLKKKKKTSIVEELSIMIMPTQPNDHSYSFVCRRAVAQRCPFPPIRNLISLGGQHQGQIIFSPI